MDILFKKLLDFYSNNKELSIALAGIVAGWLLSRVFPAVLSSAYGVLKIIGRKVGGRFSHRGIQDAYLNWVLLQNQDLNLTGIVDPGEKPQLEQVFISLRMVEEVGDRIREEASKKKQGVWKSIFDLGIGVWAKWLSKVLGAPIAAAGDTTYRELVPDLVLFKPHLFWRIRQIIERDGINTAILATAVISALVIVPAYGLFVLPDVNNLIAGIGTFMWSLSAIVVIIYLFTDLKDLATWLVASLFAGGPSIVITYVLITKVVLAGQSPMAIGLGAALAFLAMITVLISTRDNGRLGGGEPTAKVVGEQLSSHNNLAILGKPGAGKSTYVQFIALTFAQAKAGDRKLRKPRIVRERFGIHRWYLPLLIPLRKVSRFLVEAEAQHSDNLLIEVFRQQVLPSDIRAIFPISYVLHMMRKKRCLFLLDGLDEVANDIEFEAVVKEILGLASRFPGNKFVVTSRYAGWRGGLGSAFKQSEIEDLNDDQILNFVDSWYRAIEENRGRRTAEIASAAERMHIRRRAEENSSKLKEALRKVESIRSLAENPLLLSIICFVHYHKTLPKERLSLYQDCSNLLLVQWDREKGLPVDDTNLTLARKEAIMQEIAFALHSGRIGGNFGRKEATGREIIPIVESMLGRFQMAPSQAATLFQKLIDRSGIIVVVEQYTDRFAFSHLTFQEFYAAKYLHEGRLDIFDVIEQITNGESDGLRGWWREVVLLYSVMQRDPSRIIMRLFDDDNMDLLKRRLQIASQCLSEAVEVPKQDVEDAVLAQILHIRSNAAGTFNSEMPSELKQYLLRFATSTNFYKHVLSLLVHQIRRAEGVTDVLSSLIQMAGSVDREIQLASMEALINLGQRYDISRTLTQETIERLLSNSSTEVRLVAIQLILSTQPKPLNDDLSRRLVKAISELLPQQVNATGRRTLSRFLLLQEQMSQLGGVQYLEKVCRVLQEAAEAISGRERVNMQHELALKLYQGLRAEGNGSTELLSELLPKNFLWLMTPSELGVDVEVCIAKALFQLDDSNQRSMHKLQLLDGLNKGTVAQQVRAMRLLTGAFGSENDVADTIIAKLEAPWSKVRQAALSELQHLQLSGQQLLFVQDALVGGLEEGFVLRKLNFQLRQMIKGEGHLGLDLKERILAAETLLELLTPQGSVINALLSWYKNLPPRLRWSTIMEMPGRAISRLSEVDVSKVIQLYEQDRKDKMLDRSRYLNTIAISALCNLVERHGGELRDKVSSMLFDLIRDDEVSLSVLSSFEKLRPIIVEAGDQHRLLLQTLKSRNLSDADKGFDVLQSNQLV